MSDEAQTPDGGVVQGAEPVEAYDADDGAVQVAEPFEAYGAHDAVVQVAEPVDAYGAHDAVVQVAEPVDAYGADDAVVQVAEPVDAYGADDAVVQVAEPVDAYGADDEQRAPASGPQELARVVEALLFLSSEPLTVRELAEATDSETEELQAALAQLAESFAPGQRGLLLREVGGGFTFATDPVAEVAARRLFSRPRVASLTAAQAETLAIIAYLQPVSRPEIARIRGVSADSAVTTLLDRGLIEESGRSQFGAALYRTTPLFLKLFGLRSLHELPEVAQWDPTPEEQADLRDRLMRAGEARAGAGPS